MALAAAQFAVTATAAVVAPAAADQQTGSPAGQHVTIRNTDAANAAFLGGSGVTTANGYPLAIGAVLQLEMEPGEALYAIAATTSTVAVIRTGT